MCVFCVFFSFRLLFQIWNDRTYSIHNSVCLLFFLYIKSLFNVNRTSNSIELHSSGLYYLSVEFFGFCQRILYAFISFFFLWECYTTHFPINRLSITFYNMGCVNSIFVIKKFDFFSRCFMDLCVDKQFFYTFSILHQWKLWLAKK